MKIWFQNRRYKCKRQLCEKPLDGSTSEEIISNNNLNSPENHQELSNDDVLMPEEDQDDTQIYHPQSESSPILPPYSTLYGNPVQQNQYGYNPAISHQQQPDFYQAVAPGMPPVAVNDAAAAAHFYGTFHQQQQQHLNNYSSSVRAW